MPSKGFKEKQLRYERVAAADGRLQNRIMAMLSKHDVHEGPFELYLRAFKAEREIELWIKVQDEYQRMKTYAVCAGSGVAGPKRAQGDGQVPEGFYHVDRFNPMSRFHLSLGINYPNRSDLILSDHRNPGGDIFIHGDCVTIGCLPIENGPIEELYLLCVEAKDRGQENIPVTIFPSHMSDTNYATLLNKDELDEDTRLLWSELRTAYQLFKKDKQLPRVTFLTNGRHILEGN